MFPKCFSVVGLLPVRIELKEEYAKNIDQPKPNPPKAPPVPPPPPTSLPIPPPVPVWMRRPVLPPQAPMPSQPPPPVWTKSPAELHNLPQSQNLPQASTSSASSSDPLKEAVYQRDRSRSPRGHYKNKSYFVPKAHEGKPRYRHMEYYPDNKPRPKPDVCSYPQYYQQRHPQNNMYW